MSKMGSKPSRTKKCSCENSDWSIWEVRTTSASELVITLECHNCKSLWDTKSRDARQYAKLDNKIYSGKPTTYREYFEKTDEERKKLLNRIIAHKREMIAESEKEILKAQKEIDSINAGYERTTENA